MENKATRKSSLNLRWKTIEFNAIKTISFLVITRFLRLISSSADPSRQKHMYDFSACIGYSKIKDLSISEYMIKSSSIETKFLLKKKDDLFMINSF